MNADAQKAINELNRRLRNQTPVYDDPSRSLRLYAAANGYFVMIYINSIGMLLYFLIAPNGEMKELSQGYVQREDVMTAYGALQHAGRPDMVAAVGAWQERRRG